VSKGGGGEGRRRRKREKKRKEEKKTDVHKPENFQLILILQLLLYVFIPKQYLNSTCQNMNTRTPNIREQSTPQIYYTCFVQ